MSCVSQNAGDAMYKKNGKYFRAVQWSHDNDLTIMDFCQGAVSTAEFNGGMSRRYLNVYALRNIFGLAPLDWLVKEEGSKTVYKETNTVFKQLYVKV